MTTSKKRSIIVLLADDDAGDRELIRRGLSKARLANRLDVVEDGEDLINYLTRQGKHSDLADDPLPGLLLLDLNMPKMDGRAALEKIRGEEALRRLPVIVLTASDSEEDISKTYGIGANSYIVKPITFPDLIRVVKNTTEYGFDIVDVGPD